MKTAQRSRLKQSEPCETSYYNSNKEEVKYPRGGLFCSLPPRNLSKPRRNFSSADESLKPQKLFSCISDIKLKNKSLKKKKMKIEGKNPQAKVENSETNYTFKKLKQTGMQK